MGAVVLTVAHKESEGSTGDDAEGENGRARAVLDRIGRRRTVDHVVADCALHAVAEAGHRATVSA
jgi:hypothetical protein